MINLDLPRYLVLLYMPASTRKPTKTKKKWLRKVPQFSSYSVRLCGVKQLDPSKKVFHSELSCQQTSNTSSARSGVIVV